MQVTNKLGYEYTAPVEATKDNKMMGLRGRIASCMTHIDMLLSVCSICLLKKVIVSMICHRACSSVNDCMRHLSGCAHLKRCLLSLQFMDTHGCMRSRLPANVSGSWELCAGACEFGLRDETVAQAVKQMYAAKAQVSPFCKQTSHICQQCGTCYVKSAQLLLCKQPYPNRIAPSSQAQIYSFALIIDVSCTSTTVMKIMLAASDTQPLAFLWFYAT